MPVASGNAPSAVQIEAAYLAADPQLAAVLPHILAYSRRPAPAGTKRAILRRSRLTEAPHNAQRRHQAHLFTLEIHWPTSSAVAQLDADQLALDRAVDLAIVTIRGPLFDKTHGWALAVAEVTDAGGSDRIEAVFHDPAGTMDQRAATLRVDISYTAVQELTG